MIPNWNGRHFLEECLEALRAQRVRSASRRSSSTTARATARRSSCGRRFPDVRLLELGENRGFAAGDERGHRCCRDAARRLPEQRHRAPTRTGSASWSPPRAPSAAAGTAASKLVIPLGRDFDGAGDSLGREFFPFPARQRPGDPDEAARRGDRGVRRVGRSLVLAPPKCSSESAPSTSLSSPTSRTSTSAFAPG